MHFVRILILVAIFAVLTPWLAACESKSSKYSSAEECYDKCLAILEAKGRELFLKQDVASFPGVEGVNLDEIYRESAIQQCEATRRICKVPDSDSCVAFMKKLKTLDFEAK